MEIIVEFKNNQELSSIKCNTKEKFGEIIKKYKSKENIENKSLNFLYSGKIIKEESTIEELFEDENGKSEKIQIIVQSKEDKNLMKKSKSIICPKCKEDIRLKMTDYKIYLYDCKNGHKIKNILLNEFEETQNLDISKFICSICNNKNKEQKINNSKFFYCYSCRQNICQLCKENHDKNHLLVDIENKNLRCNLHNKESFIKYCNQCKSNLCFSCLEQHQGHDIILYETIKPDIKKVKDEFEKLRKTLDKFNENINQIKKCLNKVKENFEIYYKIYDDLINNYEKLETNERNYEIYQNINEINNIRLIEELNNINSSTIDDQVIEILDIYNKMVTKDIKIEENNEYLSKIIACEKCYNIPKVTFLLNNKAKIECSKCNTSIIKDVSFFEEILTLSENKKSKELPKCSFYKGHKNNAIKYCFTCKEYICEECFNIYHKPSNDQHLLLEQKVENPIICTKKGHNENKFNRYCPKCNQYFCTSCKCEHENDIYMFNEPKHQKKIDSIKEKIHKCEILIMNEETELNNFIKKGKNKFDELKKIFENYKDRNLKAINLYKVLINNYEKLKSIRNYNIENNIFINDNLNISNYKFCLKYYYDDKDNKSECLSTTLDKLYNFYINKNHVLGNKYYNFWITKKLCNRTIKKCILSKNEKIIFILFENGVFYNGLFENEKNEYELKGVRLKFNAKDAFSFNDKTFFFITNDNDLYLTTYDNNTFNLLKEFKNVNFVIKDSFNDDNFFTLNNNDEFLSIKYIINNKDTYEEYLIHEEQKKLFSIKILYEYINNLIDNSKYINKKNIRELLPQENKGSEYELLIKLDNNLVKFLDNETLNIYNEFKEVIEKKDLKKDLIINTNYIINTLNSLGKIGEHKVGKINYILELNDLIFNIRNRYFHFLVLNSKINKVYNLNNNALIFMGENYFLSEYNLKNKKFSSIITPNFIPLDDNDLNNFEIISIFYNTIILNNNKQKIFYILEKNDDRYLIENRFNYYSNVFENKNYLSFDVINDKNLEFKVIDLSNNSFVKQNELIEIFNYKISNNIPKILSFHNSNKFLLLYEKNQICVFEKAKDKIYMNTDKIIKGDELNEKDKDNKKDILDQFAVIGKEILIKNNNIIIPIVAKYSEVYSSSYEPKYLFTDDNYYYCSLNNQEQFIHFDFSKEYNFTYFKILFFDTQKNCMPQKYYVELYDNDYKKINEFEFITEHFKDNKDDIKDLRCTARYIHFILKHNFGGQYFIINKLKFYCVNDVDSC